MPDEDQPKIPKKIARQFEEGIPEYPILHPPWSHGENATVNPTSEEPSKEEEPSED